MKFLTKGFVPLLLSIGMSLSVHAQSAVSVDSTKKYLDKLMGSTAPADKVLLNDALSKLAASNNEDEMFLAVNYYYQNKNARLSDSVLKVEVQKFPLGKQARYDEQSKISDIKGAAKMEDAYNKWVKKFPPEKFPNINYDHITYDYVRSSVADEYAREKNTKKAIAFINMLEEEFWKGNGYSGLSEEFYKNGDLHNAEIYAKKAMDSSEGYLNDKKGSDNASKFAASGYAGLTNSYANILFEEKKYKQALKYSEIAYKNSTELNPQINFRYAQILAGLNRNKEAYDKLNDVVKAGRANSEMETTFKSLYIKVHGSAKGYDAYAALIRKGYLEDLSKRLAKEIMNVPAANFTLTDLDGNKVTLADLKGKIVILDFWATWCGPCKASFPAMQMAKDKYKSDPNVKFLFIHTWERGTTTPTEDARAFIKSKGYNFEVLMDLKDPETKENKVVSSYNVNGIPSKFIIDAKGVIKFHLMGFDGSNEAAVDELSMMIDLAKKGS